MVLVTGGAGYIGSHVVKELIALGEEVVVIDNLETGYEASVNEQAIFYQGDLKDTDFLNEVMSHHQIDTVMHFAAYSLVGVSMEKPLDYFKNNVYGGTSLLTAMQQNGIRRIIFSSTAATYGNAGDALITEEFPTNPTNPYGESKLAVEKLLKWCDQAYGIKFVALRYFNVAGADESGAIGEAHNPETHLIPIVLQAALGVRPSIKVFGTDYPTADGTCIRDYIHVTDRAMAHLLARHYLRQGGESQLIHLANAKGFSVLQIIEAARRVTGKEIPVEYAGRRAGDPAVLVACADKAHQVLGWQPRVTSIDDIIATAWKWHTAHPHGYAGE